MIVQISKISTQDKFQMDCTNVREQYLNLSWYFVFFSYVYLIVYHPIISHVFTDTMIPIKAAWYSSCYFSGVSMKRCACPRTRLVLVFTPVHRLTPRGYQLNAEKRVSAQNSVINIRRGGGKTLFAVLVIDNFFDIASQNGLFSCFPIESLFRNNLSMFKNIPNTNTFEYLNYVGKNTEPCS